MHQRPAACSGARPPASAAPASQPAQHNTAQHSQCPGLERRRRTFSISSSRRFSSTCLLLFSTMSRELTASCSLTSFWRLPICGSAKAGGTQGRWRQMQQAHRGQAPRNAPQGASGHGRAAKAGAKGRRPRALLLTALTSLLSASLPERASLSSASSLAMVSSPACTCARGGGGGGGGG